MRLSFDPQHYETLGFRQKLINCYPEPLPGETGFPFALPKIGGLASVHSSGDAGTLSGRGMFYVPGAAGSKLLAVWGSSLIAFDSSYNPTMLSTSLANDGRRVKFIANEIDVAILSGGSLYVYDGATVTQVTDSDLVTLADIAYLNDYLIGIEANSGRLVFALTDWTSWDALDFTTAEESPDLAEWLLVLNERVLVGGRQITEEFVPTGDADAPFAAIGAAQIPEGFISRDAALVADGTPFAVSTRRMIMRIVGGAVRISTPEIEAALAVLNDDDAGEIPASSWVERGHTFVGFDIPGYGTAVYDCASGVQKPLWHKRETYGETFWRPSTVIQAFGKTLAQGRVTDTLTDGGLFELDPDTVEDGELPLVRTWSGFLPVESGRPTIDDMALRGKVGVGLDGSGQGTDPQIMCRWSDDRGNSWSNEVWRSAGKIGEHRIMPTWRRMGRARAPGRLYEFSLSDPVDLVPWGADVNVGHP